MSKGKPRYSAIPAPGRAPGIPAPTRLRSPSAAGQYAPSPTDEFASRAFADAMKAHDPTHPRSGRTSDVSLSSVSPQSFLFSDESERRPFSSRPASAASSSSAVSAPFPQPQRPKTPSTISRPQSRQADTLAQPKNAPRASKSYSIGDNVRIESLGCEGTLRYVGEIDGKPGTWAGVELSGGFAGKGKNDGSVNGNRYFVCPPQCGVFIAATKLSRPTVGPGAISRPSSVASVRSGRITPSFSGRVTPSMGGSTSGRATPSASTSTGRITPSNNGKMGPSSSLSQRTPGLAKPRTLARPGAIPAAKSSPAKQDEKSLLIQNKITPGSRASKYIGMTVEHLNKTTRAPGATSPTRTPGGAFGLNRGPGPPSPTRASPTRRSMGSASSGGFASPSRGSSSPFATPKAKGRVSTSGAVSIPSSPTKKPISLATPRARLPSKVSMPPPASPIQHSASSNSISLNENLPAKGEDCHLSGTSPQPPSNLELNGRLLQDKISNLLSGRSTPGMRPDSSASVSSAVAAEQQAAVAHLQSRLDALEQENKALVADTERRYSDRVTTLHSQNTEIQSKLSSLESQLKTSERSLDEKDSKIEVLERSVKQSQAELEKARGDAENRIKDLQSNLEDKDSLIAELKNTINAEKGALDENDAELKAKDTEIALLGSRLQKVTADLENERKDLGAQVEELREAGQETIALYEERLSAADFRRYELEDQVAVLQHQLKQQVGTSPESTGALPSTAAQIDNEALREQVQYLQQKITSLEDMLEEARATNESDEAVIEERTQRYKEKEDALRKQVEEGRAELEKATQSETSARTRIQEIEEAFRESTVALENARAEIEGLRAEITNLEGLTASMSSGDSSDKIAEIAQRNARDRARMNEELTRVKEELDEARKAQREAESDVGSHSMVGPMNDVHTRMKELEAEKDQMDEALKVVREQLEAERKMAAEMRQAMEDQETEMEALRKRVNRDVSIVNNGLQEQAKSSVGSKHDTTAARDEIKGLKHIVQELQQENLAASQQNKALASENELLSSEMEKLRGDLTALENNLEQSLLLQEQALEDGGDDAAAHKARRDSKLKYEMELEQLRKRHAEAELKSARTIHDLNKEVSELETLVESKIYREDELEHELERLKEKLAKEQRKSSKSTAEPEETRVPFPSGRTSISSMNALQLDQGGEEGEQVCEICERPGHDIFSCDLLSDDAASMRSGKSGHSYTYSKPAGADLYCEDCEGHGHIAAECPHSLDVF